MVPDGWREERLENLAVVERGKFSARPRNDPQFYGGNVPFVQTGDIAASGGYLKSYSQTLNEQGVGVSRIFPKNTILVTIAANIGDIAITTFDVACPDSIVAIRAKPEAANFLWLKAALDVRKGRLNDQATQNAQKNINLQVLRPMTILTPPLREQSKIAEILTTWDCSIELVARLIENSERQKVALMQQLLSGQRRLPGFSDECGSIPLTQIVRIETGSSNREDSADEGEFTFFDRSTDVRRSDRFLFDTEAVIVGGEGQEFLPKYFIGKFDLHQRAYALFDFKGADGKYIYYAVYVNRHLLRRFAVGSTVPSLRMGTFEKVAIWLPPVAEQQAIARVLSNCDAGIAAYRRVHGALVKEKAALMQQLLTGRRRVKLDVDSRKTATG